MILCIKSMKDLMIMDLVVKTDDGRVKHIWPKVKHPTNGVKRKAIRVCLTFSHVHDINMMMMMMMMMIMTVIITGTKSQCGRGRCGDVGTRFPSYGKQYKKSVFLLFYIISRIRGNVSPYPVNHSNLA